MKVLYLFEFPLDYIEFVENKYI